jgi:hypothetical protein
LETGWRSDGRADPLERGAADALPEVGGRHNPNAAWQIRGKTVPIAFIFYNLYFVQRKLMGNLPIRRRAE